MATIEVHDGQGRVQFVALSRDHPLLFGTSASCDVVLEGEGIRPVHGRIRWKSTKFKIEASPDAQFVLLNGRKMTTASVHQGDEIAVGPCRMFMIKVDDDQETAAATKSQVDEGRTTVLPPPSRRMSGTPEPPHRSQDRTRKGPGGETLLEREDWLGSLKRVRRPEPDVSGTYTLARANDSDGSRQDKGQKLAGLVQAVRASIARLRALSNSSAPGRERIASSPLVICLVVLLAVLVAMGFGLKSIITANIASRTYDRAVDDFNNGDYRNSIHNFDIFLESYPEDSRVGKARVVRAFANVQQYAAPDAGTWSNALEAAKEMMDQVGGEEEFRDERIDLAELIIKIGEALAARAKQSADPASLAEAESAVALHAQVAGEAAPSLLTKSSLPAKLNEARATVRKARILAETLATMDQALKSSKRAGAKAGTEAEGTGGAASTVGSAGGALPHGTTMSPGVMLDAFKDDAASRVYQARDALVDQYPDLAHNPALIQRMTAANELIRLDVTVNPTHRSAVVAPRPDPLGPPTSVVFRTSADSAPATTDTETIVFALADGFGYAINGTTGAPRWHVPLGLAAPFVPRVVPGDGTVLAFDARHNELVRLDALSGTLKWRLDLEGPIQDPPLIAGNQLVQVLPGGQVLFIALESGELQATVNLGRPLARTPVNDDSGRLIVMGRQDCVFVLSRDPLSCIAVEYLGQLDGAIPCSPARLGRFLIIPENDSLTDSRWHVLVIDKDGKRLRPVQIIEVSGWTWQTPAGSGSIVWATGDKGGYQAFAVGEETSKAPFRPVSHLTADVVQSGPAYALARSERELWVASGHAGRYVLDPEQSVIDPKTPLAPPGPAMAPIQTAGRHIVLTFQDQERGGVALWGIDPDTGVVKWKTIVGAPWPTPLTATSGSTALTTFGRDGREISLSRDQIAKGGFVTMVLPRPGEFTLPSGQRLDLVIDGKPAVAIVPHDYKNMLWVQEPGKPGGWRKIGLPTSRASNPLVWGSAILIPGIDARAYLIDPLTAQSRAEPFVPKFDRDRQGVWLAPAPLDGDNVVLADEVGRVARIALRTTPVPRLADEADRALDQRIIADPASTGGAVIVATADGKIRALAARDLSAVGSWPLAAPLASRPYAIKDGCLVMDRAGGVTAFGRDGQRTWSINLPTEVVGAPLAKDQSIAFLTADGSLHVRARADGAPLDQKTLGVLPASGLIELGDQVLIAAARGTIRPVKPEPGDASKP
jgi:outer membrane protein assembly factor BamB